MILSERTRLYDLIGEKICKSRQAKGFSQQEFAIKLRISRASVVNIEKGRQHAPLHLLWLIATTLDTDVHQLIPHASDIKAEMDESSLRKQIREQVGDNKDDENRVADFVQSL